MLQTKEKTNKQRKEKSIRSSLIFTVTIIFIVMSVIIGNNTYLIAKDSLLKTSQEMILNKALDSANIVNSRINMYVSNIQPLGILSPLTDPYISIEEKLEVLKSEKERLELTGLGTSDLQGNLVLDNGISFSVFNEEFFKRSMEGQTYFSQPFFNSHFNKMEIAISAPIYSNGKILGAVVGFTHADEFYTLASDIKVGESGFAYLLNENSDIVSHPTVTSSASVSTTSTASTSTTESESSSSTETTASASVSTSTTDVSSSASTTENKVVFATLLERVSESTKSNVEEIINNISNKVAGVNNYTEDGQTTHIGYAPIVSKGWTLIVNATENDILRDIDSIKISLTIIVLASLSIALVLLYFLINKIITAIISISNKTKDLASLDLRVSMDEKLLLRNDELGTMAKSMQSVIESIKEFANKTKLLSLTVSESSHELAAITEESYASSTAIAELSNTISTNSQEQLSEINIVSDEMQNVLSQFNIALAENNNVENLSSQAYTNIKEGLEVVADVINQMNTIKYTNDSLKSSIDEINSSSKKMNEILSVIQNIAEQTNLLALNAAIESARAGEAGRGFSVVAEEIRKLSDQTSGSVNQVSAIIKENYNLIKTSNDYMNSTNQEISKGLVKVSNTKTTFDEINSIISDINSGMFRAKEAIDKVGKSIQDVNTSINVATNISNEVSEEILNISAATEEQMAAMDEVTTSSDHLAKLATDLEEVFKNIKM